jgi:hypothetical protein
MAGVLFEVHLALRLDAQSALALLDGGHPHIADKALAYYEFRR